MEPSYRLIPLNHGQFTKVDLEDYEYLLRWTWHAAWSAHTQTYYARTNRRMGDDLSWPRGFRVHQAIFKEFGKANQRDHENGDTLDNRKNNLRRASHAQNMHNRKMDWDNKCGFKGVAPKRHCQTGEYNGRYSATLRVDGKIEHVGYFGSPEYAARAFDIRSIQTRGEFARLNFLLEDYENCSLDDWLAELRKS